MSLFGKKAKPEEGVQRPSLSPSIALERELADKIYTSLQGDVVNDVLSKLSDSGSDAWWKSKMEGHSLKVDPELLPDMWELCSSVKKTLGFDEEVDFYITGDSTVNAFSVAAEKKEEHHIVNINSALIDLMSEDELRFVVGHELGHLINRDTALSRLVMFVFPEGSKPPITLQYKIRLHAQLAELVADRYGFMAVGKLEPCVTAFFKMTSGLDLQKINVSIEALLKDNMKHLDYFLNDKGQSHATHPVNPIRVQAINLFATAGSQEELDGGLDQLISILLKVGNGEQDEQLARFIASSGLLLSDADGEVSKEEREMIIDNLGAIKVFPSAYLDEIEKGDVMEIFNDSVAKIMQINPGLREGMMFYMTGVVMSDKRITRDEMEILMHYGRKIGYTDIEIANIVASAIQRSFIPSLDSIS